MARPSKMTMSGFDMAAEWAIRNDRLLRYGVEVGQIDLTIYGWYRGFVGHECVASGYCKNTVMLRLWQERQIRGNDDSQRNNRTGSKGDGSRRRRRL